MNLKLKFLFGSAAFYFSILSLAVAETNFLDLSFDPGTGAGNTFVETVLPQPDGKVLVCGAFTVFRGQPRNYIARLNSDGSLDTNFVASPSYWVRHMALQTDGKIIIGGFFTSVEGQSRNLIARLNANGSLDPSFNPGSGGTGTLGVSITGVPDPFVFQTALQSDGKILITGNFTTYNGVGVNGIARLNTNGTLDTTFQVGSGLSTWGRSIQVLPNNQILVTGWFENYNNTSHNRMVLINPNGSPDNSFLPFFGDRTSVYTALKLSNGQYIVAGHSLNYQGLFMEEMRRLNANGTVDTNFTPRANEKVQSLALQADGKILMVGEFSMVNGVPRSTIARLNSDGTLDTTFSANVDNWGWTVKVQNDGKILFSGGFANVNGAVRGGVARLLSGPPESAPQLFNPIRTGNTFNISVATVSGKTYVLEYKNSLSVSNWILLPAVPGDGTIKILSDPGASVAERFYRVLEN
ncbi:MAG: delta-60 repeat domain-containing protein [Verrucomicrobiota bacterium]|nr:delta-60 repeat domain-containing protein [Verrucomicrobiota bacterium]